MAHSLGITERTCKALPNSRQLQNHSAMPKAPRSTTNRFGQKLLEVLREKNAPDDLNALAEAFGVAVPSTYDWIHHGRFAKERYGRLVEWSGKSLHWWFDVPCEVAAPLVAREPQAPFAVERPPWPFEGLSEPAVCGLDRDIRLRLEGAIIATALVFGTDLGNRRVA